MKFIDLYDPIMEHFDKAGADAKDVLEWLDDHPGQVPGRTITESESKDLFNTARRGLGYWPDALERTCITVVPDPEPTNAEKLNSIITEWGGFARDPGFGEWLDSCGVKAPGGDEPDAEHDRAWWVENANVNDAEDCEACGDDLCPVHHGIALGIEFVTKKIAALGDDPELFNSIPNPPKSPGGDDE